MDTKEFQVDYLKPLYTLTIGEFMELNRQMVRSLLLEHIPKPSQEDKEEHFNIRQCAKFLGCSLVSIHSYKKRGLPYYRIGRKVLFKKSEVLDFMKTAFKKKVYKPNV